ncbi:MAG: UpxY family transcription antiterminator [Sedimentisphaerales bacterium]|nr:UpxY family transcription antiterminator [Sedimentisphaerales bacterium]
MQTSFRGVSETEHKTPANSISPTSDLCPDSVSIASDDGLHWYAVKTYSYREFVVAELLAAQQIAYYLPETSERRRWADRMKTIRIPLFRNYLFVRVDPLQENFWQVLNTRGVARILGNDQGPLPVASTEIEAISRMLEVGMSITISDTFHKGDRVRILSGPLKDMEGLFVRENGKYQFAIQIELLGQMVLLEVDQAIVEKC